MASKKKFQPTENKAIAEAFRELRKGSRTTPYTTKDKRLNTKERIVARAIREAEHSAWRPARASTAAGCVA